MFKRGRDLRVVAKLIGREIVKVLLCLVVVELGLRAYGYDPSIRRAAPHPGVVGVPGEGWVHKPGRYEFSDPFANPIRTIRYSHMDDGSRDSGGAGQGPVVALLGCSFMEGYWLDDRETIGWRLQSELPGYAIKNFAVRGYGTYLSLRAMRRVQRQSAASTTFVYGFADFHAPRNVKNPLLQKMWGKSGNLEDGVGVYPVCDDEGCSTWSGAEVEQVWRSSRLLQLVAQAWESAVFVWRMPLARRVTERLLLEMRDEARGHGDRLLIAPVTPVSDEWSAFFQTNGFELVWCRPPSGGDHRELWKDDHPSPVWAERFATCLARRLREASSS